jgi:serine/threonine-protein kinase
VIRDLCDNGYAPWEAHMPARQGEVISHYRLLEKIGQGGMGIVWRALDTSLGREVALKILPESLASDPDRVARFEREARTLAALKHPNIVTIYSVEEEHGTRFLTMELVKGESLAELIPASGLTLDRIFAIGIPLASALAAAHEKGVIHRDLKPANIMVESGGDVKVLDFGLAKLRPAAPEAATTDLRTETMTAASQIVGTLPYMSPEQVQSKPVDHRSDIFSLGTTLHEMATGLRPFQGGNSPELVSSILKDTPVSVTELRAELPRHLGRIVRRCLEKDPNRRYQSALDVRNELEDLKKELEISSTAQHGTAPNAKPHSNWMIPAAIIAAVAVLVVLGIWTLGPLRQKIAGKPTSEIRALAVLPLKNLMNDPAQDYFVEGMHDALITELAKTGLKVISRTTVMAYAAKGNKPLPEIARELGVDALIEGTVLRIGSAVSVNVKLIQALTDEGIWAEQYDGDLSNAMAMLAKVTRAIAAQVKITLTPQQQDRLAGVRPVNPEAQDAYLKGRYFLNRFNTDSGKKSVEFFQKAIELDPAYAKAYAGLAMSYAIAAVLSAGSRGPETVQLFRAAGNKAVELDPQLAEGHAAIGLASLYFDWDWPRAQKELKLAIDLNPAEALVYHPYADCFLVDGKLEESLAWVEKGAKLDPLSPLIVGPVIGHLQFLRRWDDVIEKSRNFQSMFPDSRMFGIGSLRVGLWHKELYVQAMDELRKEWKNDGELLKAFEEGFAEAGPHGAMRAAAETLAARSRVRYQEPIAVAQFYAQAGDADSAFQWLERAFQERRPFLAHLKAEPSFDLIRSDPRFENILRRMNLLK